MIPAHLENALEYGLSDASLHALDCVEAGRAVEDYTEREDLAQSIAAIQRLLRAADRLRGDLDSLQRIQSEAFRTAEELRGNAEIHSRDYSLTGQTIFARIPGGSLQDVEARGRAKMFGEDLDVSAPGLDLFFENDLLQRSVARSDSALAPGQRPVATSPSTTYRRRCWVGPRTTSSRSSWVRPVACGACRSHRSSPTTSPR